MDIRRVIRHIFLTGLCVTLFSHGYLWPAIHRTSAEALFKRGKLKQSLKAYKKFARQNPFNASHWKNISCLSSDLGLLTEEYDALKKLYSQDSEPLWTLQNLGWNALARGKAEEAVEYFNKTLQIDKTDYGSLLGMGISYYVQEQLPKAEQMYRTLAQYHPYDASAHYLLGEVYFLQGDDIKAEENLKQCLKKDYAMPEAKFLLVKVYMRSQKAEKAWKTLVKVLRIDPSHKEARALKRAGLFDPVRKFPEVSPLARLAKHSEISPVSNPETIPSISVGLAVDGKGSPQNITSIHCNVKGTVETTIGSGKEVFLVSQEFSEWHIRLSTHSSSIEILDDDGSVKIHTTHTVTVIPASDQDTIIIREVPYATGYAWAGQGDREYRGTIMIRRTDDRLVITNKILFEEYLFSVLPSEMIASWPEEALQAQAVIARGFSWHKKKFSPHKKYGYDVCSGQHCQVYAGVNNENRRTSDAVRATRAEILMYRSRIANTLYSSNCGGRTQSSRDLKGWGEVEYLTGVSDMVHQEKLSPYTLYEFIHNHNPVTYCAPSKYTYDAESRWIRILSADYLTERVNRTYRVGSVKDIVVLKRAPSGHIRVLNIIGSKRNMLVEKENHIRGIFAPGGLRSTFYTVDTIRVDKRPSYFVFRGGGWGHAVGMCQSGAAGMAQEGSTYTEILEHYYQGTHMKKLPW